MFIQSKNMLVFDPATLRSEITEPLGRNTEMNVLVFLMYVFKKLSLYRLTDNSGSSE